MRVFIWCVCESVCGCACVCVCPCVEMRHLFLTQCRRPRFPYAKSGVSPWVMCYSLYYHLVQEGFSTTVAPVPAHSQTAKADRMFLHHATPLPYPVDNTLADQAVTISCLSPSQHAYQIYSSTVPNITHSVLRTGPFDRAINPKVVVGSHAVRRPPLVQVAQSTCTNPAHSKSLNAVVCQRRQPSTAFTQ